MASHLNYLNYFDYLNMGLTVCAYINLLNHDKINNDLLKIEKYRTQQLKGNKFVIGVLFKNITNNLLWNQVGFLFLYMFIINI